MKIVIPNTEAEIVIAILQIERIMDRDITKNDVILRMMIAIPLIILENANVVILQMRIANGVILQMTIIKIEAVVVTETANIQVIADQVTEAIVDQVTVVIADSEVAIVDPEEVLEEIEEDIVDLEEILEVIEDRMIEEALEEVIENILTAAEGIKMILREIAIFEQNHRTIADQILINQQ